MTPNLAMLGALHFGRTRNQLGLEFSAAAPQRDLDAHRLFVTLTANRHESRTQRTLRVVGSIHLGCRSNRSIRGVGPNAANDVALVCDRGTWRRVRRFLDRDRRRQPARARHGPRTRRCRDCSHHSAGHGCAAGCVRGWDVAVQTTRSSSVVGLSQVVSFQKTVIPAAQYHIEDKGASPAISETRVAGEGLMLLPFAPRLGYSRVARALQRIKFTVWHVGERRDPREKKRFGNTSR